MSIAAFRFRFSFRQPALSILALAALTGCGEGEDSPRTPVASQAAPSSDSATASAGTTAMTSAAATPGSSQPGAVTPLPATGGTTQNRAPTISGTPHLAINAGSSYAFVPTAADADGDTLAFTIANKPAWATFNTTTGRLSGTPTAAQVGNYANITVSVSDGAVTRSLATFAIAVSQISKGSATLSWTPPTENTDGSPLTNLSGFQIHYGTSGRRLEPDHHHHERQHQHLRGREPALRQPGTSPSRPWQAAARAGFPA